MDSLEFSPANIKRWSRVGSRATFGLVALDLGEAIDDLIILTSDVSTSAGLDRFRKQHPNISQDIAF
jgi:transketolase